MQSGGVNAAESSVKRPGTADSGVGLGLLLAVELLLLTVANWPAALRFTDTAFGDVGGTLNVQKLLELGLRPALDFGYEYGLLPLLVARGWFAVFGQTNIAYIALNMLCNAIVGLGLARSACALRLPRFGIFFIALAAPLIVQSVYFNITHALETALLVHALAEHVRGRRNVALALVTACAFVKPGMAYVYGLVLVLLIVRAQFQKRSTTWSAWARELAPATATGACLLALVIGVYGASAFLTVQFPLGLSHAYKLHGYGFFNDSGRNFLHPRGVRFSYYFGTFTGAWLVMICLLLAGSIFTISNSARKKAWLTLPEEFAVTIAVLQMAFVCLFFATWFYYNYILFLGTLAILIVWRRARVLMYPLAAMLLLVYVRRIPDTLKLWRTLAPSSQTAGLWATPAERSEWQHVSGLTRAQKPLVLKLSGCAEVLFPEFHGTQSFWTSAALLPVLPAIERQRIQDRIETASSIVVAQKARGLVQAPLLRDSFSRFSLIWHGEAFDVYRRSERRVSDSRTAN